LIAQIPGTTQKEFGRIDQNFGVAEAYLSDTQLGLILKLDLPKESLSVKIGGLDVEPIQL
jgi:hypothetical protein